MRIPIASLSDLGIGGGSSNLENAEGILPLGKGGTGKSLTSDPSLLVNLNSGTAASTFDTSPRPGVAGTLPVSKGGTGVTSLETLATNISEYIEVDSGSPDMTSATGVLAVSHGGTGKSSLTANSVPYASSSSALAFPTAAAGALYKTSTTAAPQFGALPVAQGGTGATTAKNAATNIGAMTTSGGTFTGDVTVDAHEVNITNAYHQGINIDGSYVELNLGGTSDNKVNFIDTGNCMIEAYKSGSTYKMVIRASDIELQGNIYINGTKYYSA